MVIGSTYRSWYVGRPTKFVLYSSYEVNLTMSSFTYWAGYVARLLVCDANKVRLPTSQTLSYSHFNIFSYYFSKSTLVLRISFLFLCDNFYL